MFNSRKFGAILIMGAAFGMAACSDDDDDDLIDPGPETFETLMTGFQESPAVNTSATGTAKIVFNDAGFTYEVNVNGISNVTAAHIHTSVTGGVAFNVAPNTTVTTGVLAQGQATAASTFSAGFTVDSVKSLIRRGNAYVNVHNTANPGGHIRGQLVRTN
jgi:hypothetical protein